MNIQDFELGRTYRDVITGFAGIATGKVTYITGCDQVLLAPQSMAGKPAEPVWYDLARLELVAKAKKISLAVSASSPGPDRPAPIR